MRWLQQASIKQKTVVAFLSVTLLAVLLITAFTQYSYGKEVEKDFFRISHEAASRLNYHMDYYFSQLEQSTVSLIQSDQVQDWLVHPDNPDLETENELSKALRKYLGMNHQEIVDMFLVASNGYVIAGNGATRGSSAYVKEPWYALADDGSAAVLPSHQAFYPQSGRGIVLSLVIPIYSKDNLALIGRVIVDITLKEIARTFANSGLADHGAYFIVDGSRLVIYHPNLQWIGLQQDQTGLAGLDLTELGRTSVQNWQGSKQLIAVVKSQSTGWYIVAQVPFDEMAGGLLAARRSSMMALTVIILVIFLTVPLLSNRLVEPIKRLKRSMELVAQGRLEVRAPILPGSDEFQHLNRSFNQMVERLNELMDDVAELKLREARHVLLQKDAFIRALQNQINPHLLYNSLDIIRSMAYLEKKDAVIVMAKSLAEVYRYTARMDRKEVALREELEVLKKYLNIVHIRFPKHFQSTITVHEKYLEHAIVKLTLQPIVENAVKYAVEPKAGKAAIIISAYEEGTDLCIEIADNGPGIPPERLDELQKKLEALTLRTSENYAEQESLGIANVHARLVLQYGVPYGLSVVSFPGRGTVITIRLPQQEIKFGQQIDNLVKESGWSRMLY
ncbi:cache domain-containing sensor histidine kinase [Paenibacillus cremeus]|uniref:histidine kinase n=1 Tax=Paenibacillus cremeus TaxID=2163881 RepID=A0A559KGQ1_9BACL|nr:sensor histidine kinase [Paenibacillus cremeus]TVY11313.1 sensor histidine kinase [Paenibacillus cremeus]